MLSNLCFSFPSGTHEIGVESVDREARGLLMRNPVVRQVVSPDPQQGLPVQLLQLSNFCKRKQTSFFPCIILLCTKLYFNYTYLYKYVTLNIELSTKHCIFLRALYFTYSKYLHRWEEDRAGRWDRSRQTASATHRSSDIPQTSKSLVYQSKP